MADMTREEAARVLEMLSGDLLNIENADLINKILDAMSMGATALRGWVKTADRLPTEADANKNLCVLAMVARDRQIRVARYKELYAKEFDGAYYFSHWMTLPEVEG
jgi:hypothetical protein